MLIVMVQLIIRVETWVAVHSANSTVYVPCVVERKLTDMTIDRCKAGDLLFPSKQARDNVGGGSYYCTERRNFMKDYDIFPAILLEPATGTVSTPTGIHVLGTTATVGVAK